MTARVTASQVKELIPTELADEVVDDNFIDTANVMVDQHLIGKGLPDTLLTKIELYLAAHLVALSEEHGGMITDSVGDATTRFANVYGAGLNSTRFGQQALALDVSGTLVKVSSNKLRAEFRVV